MPLARFLKWNQLRWRNIWTKFGADINCWSSRNIDNFILQAVSAVSECKYTFVLLGWIWTLSFLVIEKNHLGNVNVSTRKVSKVVKRVQPREKEAVLHLMTGWEIFEFRNYLLGEFLLVFFIQPIVFFRSLGHLLCFCCLLIVFIQIACLLVVLVFGALKRAKHSTPTYLCVFQ